MEENKLNPQQNHGGGKGRTKMHYIINEANPIKHILNKMLLEKKFVEALFLITTTKNKVKV